MNDVIVDALMVEMTKEEDSADANEELQSFDWMALAVGGILGSLSASYIEMEA